MRLRARASRAVQSRDPTWMVEAESEPVLLRRRRGDRRPAPVGVRVSETELGVTFEAFDLTAQSVFLRSELLLSIGDTLRIEIARESGPVVVVSGEVVAGVSDPDLARGDAGAGVLVEFRDLTLGDLETLLALAG